MGVGILFTGLPRRWPKVAGGRAMEPPRRAVRLRGRGYQLLVALILLSTLTILHLHPPSTTPRSRGSTSPLVRAAADAPNGGALAELQVTADGAAALTTGGRAADDVHARNAHHPAAQPPSTAGGSIDAVDGASRDGAAGGSVDAVGSVWTGADATQLGAQLGELAVQPFPRAKGTTGSSGCATHFKVSN